MRDLDCSTGQTCESNACVTGSDAGGDATSDGGGDGGSCTLPVDAGKPGTVTGSTGMPATDGVATVKSGPDGTEFVQEIRIKIGDFTNMCGYATEGRLKANASFVYVDLLRRGSSLPPAFENKAYTIGRTTAGGVEESINWAKDKLDAACMPGDVPMPTGTITITGVTADRVAGRYDITDDGWGPNAHSGTFDVPICNPTTTEATCCIP